MLSRHHVILQNVPFPSMRTRRIRQILASTSLAAFASVTSGFTTCSISTCAFKSNNSLGRQSTQFYSEKLIRHCASVVELQDGAEMETELVLPLEKGSHGSAKLVIPVKDEGDGIFDDPVSFQQRFRATVAACRHLEKSSLWVYVPISRARLIECMIEDGLQYHHAEADMAVLNVWLRSDSESKVPPFATHQVGVGALVVNSRNEVLCVRELRRNYLPWKTPTGLSDLGESIEDAAVREVMEETGIPTKFHGILGFRQTHGLKHGRSDMFFVCRLDPIEKVDDEGNVIIPQPKPQETEIECAEWVPMSEYRKMVYGEDGGIGHPMMKVVMDVFDAGLCLDRNVVESVVPGRPPNSIYFPMKER